MLNTNEGKKELYIIKNDGKSDGSGWQNQDSYAGCTANVALLYNKDLYIANAGDSRAVLSVLGKA